MSETVLTKNPYLLRLKWIERSQAYYGDILKLLRFFIPEGARVLEVGSASGWLLGKLDHASHRVGVERKHEAVLAAREQNPQARYLHADFESPGCELGEKFDFIVASDVFPFAYDIQMLLDSCRRHLDPDSEGRVFVSCYNSYLRPVYRVAEWLGLKGSGRSENWVTVADVDNLADLAGFEVVRTGFRCLVPWNLLGVGTLINRWIAPLPIFNYLNLYYYALLRPKAGVLAQPARVECVSVVVPARNESGNIQAAVDRLPRLAPKVELIFVEGNSTDDTWQAVLRAEQGPRPEWLDIVVLKQPGKGKADAVHTGFAKATGDILVILDADLTVPPEELERFVRPLREGTADFTHGDRLTYPMEGQAMRFLNMLGNKFFGAGFTFILDQKFKDTLCGTKVLWRRDWPKILKLRSYFGDFDPFGDFELLFGAVKLNHKLVQIPVHYKARTYGETNIQRWRHGWILLKMLSFAAPRMRFI